MSEGTSLSDLIERLEKATGPDRELDAEIQEVGVGLEMYESIAERGGERCIRYYPGPPGPTYRALPRYTSSIDAAMTLVPERHDFLLSGITGDFSAEVGPEDSFQTNQAQHVTSTPAIALCIAALKARAATEVE